MQIPINDFIFIDFTLVFLHTEVFGGKFLGLASSKSSSNGLLTRIIIKYTYMPNPNPNTNPTLTLTLTVTFNLNPHFNSNPNPNHSHNIISSASSLKPNGKNKKTESVQAERVKKTTRKKKVSLQPLLDLPPPFSTEINATIG